MTVTQTMANVLDKIRRTFYADRIREYKRDERQLMRAVATYGHECNQRGWNFDAEAIYQALMELLLEIRTAQADIKYFPRYLEGAIKRHIDQKADKLNAQAKALAPKIRTIIDKLKPVEVIRQASDVEVFSEVWRGIGKIQRAKKKGKAPAAAKQGELI